ncbi:MAG: hypothetical protein ACXVH7_01390 [Thermoanaerobaculia bacterium]
MRFTGEVIATALLVLLVAPHTAAAEAFEIDIARPRLRIISRDDIRFHCRTPKHIEGCTEFLGEILAARCERRETDWHIAAVARFIPYVYVISPGLVAHERLHVDDITQQLQTFLGDLTSRSFPDESSCRSDADFESAVFTLRMDVLRTESNRRLH